MKNFWVNGWCCQVGLIAIGICFAVLGELNGAFYAVGLGTGISLAVIFGERRAL